MDPVRDESSRKRICDVFHAVEHDVHLLEVVGELDLYSAPLLEAEIAKCADGNAVVVDLLQCRFLAAAGLSLLVRLHKRKPQRYCIVAAADGVPYKVLRITELDKTMRVAFTLDEARMHFRKPARSAASYIETTTSEHLPSPHGSKRKRKIFTG